MRIKTFEIFLLMFFVKLGLSSNDKVKVTRRDHAKVTHPG